MPATSRYKRSVLVTLSLLAVLIGVPCWSVWWAVRQQRLDHDLIASIKANDTRRVISLLGSGADANTRDAPPTTISFWRLLQDVWKGNRASGSEHPTALLVALLMKDEGHGSLMFSPENVAMVKALLDHGANVNCKGGYGDDRANTPIIEAVVSGKAATCHLLMERGANVRNKQDYSPVCIATHYSQGKTDILADLIHHGADVNQPWCPTVPDTALVEAAELGYADVARLLLAHNAQTALRDEIGLTALHKALQEDLQGFMDPTGQRETIRGRRQIVKMLRDAGAKE